MKKNNLIKKLVYFETKVAHLFNNKKIKAPIHLYYGNEEAILKVFEKVKKNDWVICSWRSHYQCLLKGVPENLLIKEGFKIVIYANQLMRSAYPAMKETALSILKNLRSYEVEKKIVPIKKIISLIK